MSRRPRHRSDRRRLVPRLAALVAVLAVVIGCASGTTARPGAPAEPATATAAVLDEMAAVFEEALAGAHVSSAAFLAEDLAATRAWAHDHRGWPAADYAVVEVPRSTSSDPGAVGLVVWLQGEETAGSWTAVCASAQVDRAAARLRLQQVHCPQDIPGGPLQQDSSEEQAQLLDLALQPHGGLISGEPPTLGDPVTGRWATERAVTQHQCQAESLRATLDSGNAAGDTDDFFLRVQNVSATACELSALPSIKIDDGDETVEPSWNQQGVTVTLQPWESATTHLSYRPHEGRSGRQAITVQTSTGPIWVRPPAGDQVTLRVAESTEVRVTPWQLTGFGVALGRWEDGYPLVDIAPPCRPQQIAVTAPAPPPRSSGRPPEEPPEMPYFLLNISTMTCRLEPGPLTPLEDVPTLQVPSTIVLLPGTTTDLEIEGGAPDLSGTLIVDGTQIPVTGP